MNDEEAILRAVLEHPEDIATRAIFGDWLEEQGQEGGIVSFSSTTAFGVSHSYTIVYGPTLVAVSTVLQRAHRVAQPAWRCGPLAAFGNKPTDQVARWELPAVRRCQKIDSWAKVKALAVGALRCDGHTPGGTSYHHILWDRSMTLDVTWSANASDHPQGTLITAYHSLIALAALLPTQIERGEPVSEFFRPLA
jgi:uncharacterized protein (TIGR02996 family)